MKIGVLFCGYKCDEDLKEVLSPWITLQEKLNFSIAAVHGMFKEYHDMGYPDVDYVTQNKLKEYKEANIFDFLYLQNDYDYEMQAAFKYETEAQIRDKAFQYFIKRGDIDYVILLDSDEFYTVQEIENIFNFVKENPKTVWFSINFKNYIGDGWNWIDGFCPARIFKMKTNYYYANEIYYDNDVSYSMYDVVSAVKFSYKYFPTFKISKKIAHIRHLSWTNDKAEDKIKYQEKHFGGECSYEIVDGNIKLKEEYYVKHNKPIPSLNCDFVTPCEIIKDALSKVDVISNIKDYKLNI